MKKILTLLSLVLMVSASNLSAQDTTRLNRIPMPQDSVMTPENRTPMERDRMNRDSMRMSMDKNRSSDKTMSSEKNTMKTNKSGGMAPDLTGWPEPSRMAVDEITSKYGNPDGGSDDELIWMDKGVWKKIRINKAETKHSFPIEHTDMMETTISYKVPVYFMEELGRFDGSITFDRTQGTMSARCDKEANNFLALNLAHDIIRGKKSVQQARKAYGNIVKEKMNGGNPLYMQKLTFSTQEGAADPDKNTTGLRKEDVMKGVKKNTNDKNN